MRFAALTEATATPRVYSATASRFFDSAFARRAPRLESAGREVQLPDGAAYLSGVTYEIYRVGCGSSSAPWCVAGQAALRPVSQQPRAMSIRSARGQPEGATIEAARATRLEPSFRQGAAITVATHDGPDGRVEHTGGLSFRTGDFFGGRHGANADY